MLDAPGIGGRHRASQPFERDISAERDEVRGSKLALGIWLGVRKRIDAAGLRGVPQSKRRNDRRNIVVVLLCTYEMASVAWLW
jgi:hypothetical protein